MEDWNGKTSIGRDLLNRVVKVTDHDGRETEYGWDNVGNKTVQGYPDGTQVDYYYDAENQIVEMKDFDGGITKFEYDANGNKTFKEYPNYETAYYFYDECDRIIEMDEYNLGGKKLFKTTYSWDAEGNRLSEMQYNHGQSGTSGNGSSNNGNGNNGNGNGSNAVISGALFNVTNALNNLLEGGSSGTTSSQDTQDTPDAQSVRITPEVPSVEIPSVDTERLSTENSIVNSMTLPDPTADTAAGVVLNNQAKAAEELNAQLQDAAIEAEAPKPETPDSEADKPEAETPDTELPEGNKPETGKDDASIEGNGDGNGQVPPGQTEDEDGNIVNPGGHMPPGLNRGEKGEKPDNPNKPTKPDNPGTEDNTDKQANKANKGTHKYTYDELNRMTTSNIAGTTTTYTYDTLGNLVLEKAKNHVVDYQYNELNQLVQKKDGNESYTYTYDKRGNRTAEIGKKASRSYVYDETNRMVEGTNWKGDKSAYTYNGLGIRINNTHTTHAGKVYARDYVIDYTSFENDDLMVFAEGNGQLEYEQKHVYAGSERIEQFTDKGNWERTLYVHEDVMGNTRYYTKANGQSFAELTYDAWGMPESPNKLLNNDHGNYVFATFTGHIYDTTLDIYFAEARFYDANNRTWLAMDPIKDGQNWYQYCYSNPTTYYDPLGLWGTTTGSKQAQLSGSGYGTNVSAEILLGLLRMREFGYYVKDFIHNLTSGTIIAAMQDLGGNSSNGDSPTPGFEIPYYFGKILGHAWTIALVAVITDYGTGMTLGGAAVSGSGAGIVISIGGVLVIAKCFEVIIDVGTNLGKDFGALIQEFSNKNNGNSNTELPHQGTVQGDVENAPPVDAGKQGKHVQGHPNYREGNSTWLPGNNGVHDTQEAWINGTELPDGTRVWDTKNTVGTNGETGVRVHIDKKGNIHGYPVDPERYLQNQ